MFFMFYSMMLNLLMHPKSTDSIVNIDGLFPTPILMHALWTHWSLTGTCVVQSSWQNMHAFRIQWNLVDAFSPHQVNIREACLTFKSILLHGSQIHIFHSLLQPENVIYCISSVTDKSLNPNLMKCLWWVSNCPFLN